MTDKLKNAIPLMRQNVSPRKVDPFGEIMAVALKLPPAKAANALAMSLGAALQSLDKTELTTVVSNTETGQMYRIKVTLEKVDSPVQTKH